MADLVEDVGEEEQTEGPEEKKGFLTLPKIIIIAAVVLLLGGGFLGFKSMGSGKDELPDPFLYELPDQVMVGVRGTSHTRTLMCKIWLKLESESMVEEIEKKKPEFIDMLVRILQKYKIEELDYVGQNKVRRDIEDEFNLNLDSGKVLKVFFTEFLIR